MQYFNQCTTIEEVKALYKQLAKQHPPDCGGDTAIMQAINEEYDKACIVILRENDSSEDEFEKEMKVSDEYRQVIGKIINLPGIVIELVGHLYVYLKDTDNYCKLGEAIYIASGDYPNDLQS